MANKVMHYFRVFGSFLERVGGIDLYDGRFDDEIHSLFRTLNTGYSDDFQ